MVLRETPYLPLRRICDGKGSSKQHNEKGDTDMTKCKDNCIYCPFSFSATAAPTECIKGNCALFDNIEGICTVNEAGFYSSDIAAALTRIADSLRN